MWISACAGLMIGANFSFAWASAMLLLVTGLLVALRERPALPSTFGRVAAACLLPAASTLLVFAGWTIWRFPHNQLFWGSTSWRESWKMLGESSFEQLNPHLVNPLLAGTIHSIQDTLIYGPLLLTWVYAAMLLPRRWEGMEPETKKRVVLAGSYGAVLALAVFAHGAQYWWFGIPLPYERTSLFVIPLAGAMFGTMASAHPWNRWVRICQMAAIALLCLTAVYFAGSLRDSHFKQWKTGAEVKQAFPVVVEWCRREGVREAVVDQNLASSFNFYREIYGVTDVAPFRNYDAYPPGRPLYVVIEQHCGDCLMAEKLREVWRGQVSGMLILAR